MKDYKDIDYALNKYRQGIVYKFADRIAKVTLLLKKQEETKY